MGEAGVQATGNFIIGEIQCASARTTPNLGMACLTAGPVNQPSTGTGNTQKRPPPRLAYVMQAANGSRKLVGP